MKRKILSMLLSAMVVAGFSTTHTITNSGTTFSPSTITINQGDSVNFSLSNSHNAVEVSEATWNANGTTSLPGFSAPLGGGLILPQQLTVGTHYFVCVPHASFGMKGTIIVEGTTGIAESTDNTEISIFPSPSNGQFHLTIKNSDAIQNYKLDVFDISGASVFTTQISNEKTTNNIDLSAFPKGIYFLNIYNEAEHFTKKIIIH